MEKFLVEQLRLMLPTIGILTILVLLAWRKGWLGPVENREEGDPITLRKDHIAQLTKSVEDMRIILQQMAATQTMIAQTQTSISQTLERQTEVLRAVHDKQLVHDFQLSEVFKRSVGS